MKMFEQILNKGSAPRKFKFFGLLQTLGIVNDQEGANNSPSYRFAAINNERKREREKRKNNCPIFVPGIYSSFSAPTRA